MGRTVFKQQRANEKSELFARKYSELAAKGEYSKWYVFSVAALYEEAITEGRPDGFALDYAEDLGEYICNHYSDFNEAMEDEFYKVKRAEVIARLGKY